MEMKEILAASTALGFDILSHGAETYRVEESITRMCAAYGYQNTDVFVIPSSIVVTITDDTGAYLTRTRRILSREADESVQPSPGRPETVSSRPPPTGSTAVNGGAPAAGSTPTTA